jgi:hypothetical protein
VPKRRSQMIIRTFGRTSPRGILRGRRVSQVWTPGRRPR